MAWIVLVLLLVLLFALARSFFISARALLRDANRPFDRFRASLEDEANRVVEMAMRSGDRTREDHR